MENGPNPNDCSDGSRVVITKVKYLHCKKHQSWCPYFVICSDRDSRTMLICGNCGCSRSEHHQVIEHSFASETSARW